MRRFSWRSRRWRRTWRGDGGEGGFGMVNWAQGHELDNGIKRALTVSLDCLTYWGAN